MPSAGIVRTGIVGMAPKLIPIAVLTIGFSIYGPATAESVANDTPWNP